ncbi:MAG TPA: ABC transporter substrate-binding protein [Candidatus Binatia bacterium]|jgi:NitT/TauT family transport system substrate-binding protein|nr:ABC transporter substrate-binding protein [Candidatus Binatia bacterium]
MRNFRTIRAAVLSLLCLLAAAPADAQERRKVRISNANFSFTALPLIAAREWKHFSDQGLDVEVILMRSAAAAAALASGDLDYQSGIGTATVGASMSGLDTRALWSSTNQIAYWLMARPEIKTLPELKNKRIGVSGLGGTSHLALVFALEKQGFNPKDVIIIGVPPGQLVASLESKYLDAISINPPYMFSAQRQGFRRLLDVGAFVEMPSGGLTATLKTIKTRPEEIKKVIRALQLAKKEMLKAKEKTLDLIVRVLNMDRTTAAETYTLVQSNFNDSGVPTQEGMNNIVRMVQSQVKGPAKHLNYLDVAEPRFAIEVAKELGYKLE